MSNTSSLALEKVVFNWENVCDIQTSYEYYIIFETNPCTSSSFEIH